MATDRETTVQPVDIAVIAAIVTGAVGVWIARGRRWPIVASITIIVAAIVGHVLVAPPRWQFVAVHVAGAGVVFVALAELRGVPLHLRRLALTTAVAIVAVGTTAAWSLPVTALSEPTGTYPVGQQSLTIVDPTRVEVWGPDPGSLRRIGVSVWYPTVSGYEGPQASWIPARAAAIDAVADLFRIPGFTLQHLSEVTTSAFVEAPIAEDGPFPVALFSHGWSGASVLHTDLMLALASHGYIVIAIDHTYVSLVTVLGDDIVVLDPTTLDVRGDNDAYDASAAQLITIFADDIDVALSEVLADPLLGQAADSQRVVATGHSTGGGAAIVACARSNWCDAVVGLDPWVEPVTDDVIGNGLDVPILSISSAEWAAMPNDKRLRRLHAASRSATGRVVIADSAHQDFTLVPDIIRAGQPLGVHGDTPSETRAITADWMRRFLDHHLYDRGPDPLQFAPADLRVTINPR